MTYFLRAIQQRFNEWRMIGRVRSIQRKGLWFSDLQGNSVSSLPSVRIEYGDFNHEGRRVLDLAMAGFMMRDAVEEGSFSFYLEKAKEINDQLGLDGLSKFLLDNRCYTHMFIESN